MNLDSEAAIIINDLDNMVHRIEGLQAHPEYTNALIAVQAAKQSMVMGRGALHQHAMKERFAKLDAQQ